MVVLLRDFDWWFPVVAVWNEIWTSHVLLWTFCRRRWAWIWSSLTTACLAWQDMICWGGSRWGFAEPAFNPSILSSIHSSVSKSCCCPVLICRGHLHWRTFQWWSCRLRMCLPGSAGPHNKPTHPMNALLCPYFLLVATMVDLVGVLVAHEIGVLY